MRIARDEIFGLGAVAVAAAYWAAADRIQVSLLADSVGADGVPKALAGILAICGTLLTVTTRLKAQPRDTPETGPAVAAAERRTHLRAAGLLIGLAVYAMLMPIIGYPIALALLIGGAAVYGGMRARSGVIAVSAAAGIGFWLLFRLLGVSMPLGDWLPGA